MEIKAGQQVTNRGFSASGWPHQRGGLSFAYGFVEVAYGANTEDLLPLMVLLEDVEHLVDDRFGFAGIRVKAVHDFRSEFDIFIDIYVCWLAVVLSGRVWKFLNIAFSVCVVKRRNVVFVLFVVRHKISWRIGGREYQGRAFETCRTDAANEHAHREQ